MSCESQSKKYLKIRNFWPQPRRRTPSLLPSPFFWQRQRCRFLRRWPSTLSRSHKNQTSMPFVHITWLPKACRSPAVRKEVSDAVMKAMINCKSADISPDNLVVRFSEAVDGFPLPKGHSNNPDLQAPQVPGAEAFLKDR